MAYTQLVDQLIQALRCLPGVGPRSAQRMAIHLLRQGRSDGAFLAQTLEKALTHVGHCLRCRTFSEHDLCNICSNPKRDRSILCIVETPIDIIAIEQTNSYRGLYFALMGHLSPIDGLGPNEIGINELHNLLNLESDIEEIIIATNPTVEGEATAHYIATIVRANGKSKCTRIAHGIPFGGELEYTDSNTLAQALARRIEI
ncbi:MAG: recombination protein RecR [Gammaproteobacteria bacterium RBG_16_37_9]|nr:MAG: recombination protein RecR [Gammaproteobacteria bacterium RBG_16_37_9]